MRHVRLTMVVSEAEPRWSSVPDTILSGPESLASAIGHLYRDEPREIAYGFGLDGRNRIISAWTVSVGTTGSTLVHPREVFTPALLSNASSVVLCHNHPSGNPEPSGDDISLTKRLVSCGQHLGVPLVDHVVIGWAEGACRWRSCIEGRV